MKSGNSAVEISYTVGANKYRRQTLSILAEERTLSVSELAKRLTTHPSNTSASESKDTRIRKTRLALCHVHLPKLDESGLVSYAHDAAEVTVPEEVVGTLPEIAETLQSSQTVELNVPHNQR